VLHQMEPIGNGLLGRSAHRASDLILSMLCDARSRAKLFALPRSRVYRPLRRPKDRLA
jgi:hypothetical protein